MPIDKRDMACGLVFIAIGLFFAIKAWFELRIGSAASMGPGYFPFGLGLVMSGFGVAVAIRAFGRAGSIANAVGWRGMGLIALAVVVFALTIRGLGMLPSLMVSTLIVAMAPKEAKLFEAMLFSGALSAFNTGIFIYALRLPYPVIGQWLKGLI
jgi:hypothetical protein